MKPTTNHLQNKIMQTMQDAQYYVCKNISILKLTSPKHDAFNDDLYSCILFYAMMPPCHSMIALWCVI